MAGRYRVRRVNSSTSRVCAKRFRIGVDKGFVSNVEGESAAGMDRLLAAPRRAVRVLAAEDNPVFQSMLRSMLTKWGYDPVIARDGAEAWHALDAVDAPWLAILDWMMPGIDGVEICRRVRAASREPYIYILLLTGRTELQRSGGRYGSWGRRLPDQAFYGA